MIKHLVNQRGNIFLPQPCTVKQYSVYLPGARSDLVLLMLENQKAQALQCKVFPEISMLNSTLLVLVDDLLPVTCLIVLRRFNNMLHLILHPDEQVVPIWLLFDKFYRMAHQLHQIVVI